MSINSISDCHVDRNGDKIRGFSCQYSVYRQFSSKGLAAIKQSLAKLCLMFAGSTSLFNGTCSCRILISIFVLSCCIKNNVCFCRPETLQILPMDLFLGLNSQVRRTVETTGATHLTRLPGRWEVELNGGDTKAIRRHASRTTTKVCIKVS